MFKGPFRKLLQEFQSIGKFVGVMAEAIPTSDLLLCKAKESRRGLKWGDRES